MEIVLVGLAAASLAAAASEPAVVRDQHQIAAFGGRLVGSDRSEWGGTSAFVSDTGQRTSLIGKSVFGLHEMPFGDVVVTGLAHLSIDEGEWLLVTRRGARRIRVDRPMTLAHAPVRSWQRNDRPIDIALDTGTSARGDDHSEPVFSRVNGSVSKRLTATPCPSSIGF